MPGKHVRFADTNILYSPLPSPSPSPDQDTSSLPPCSPTLSKLTSTPDEPPLSLTPSIKLFPLLPPEAIVQVHPILQFTPYPALTYDISFPPSTITTPHYQALPEPAVFPPLAYLALICPDLPWPITITPSALLTPDAFVSVEDVLVALHRALRLAVHPDEYNSLPSHEDKHKVNTAYENRYLRLADAFAHDEERRKGVKRVDFLMGRTRFLGLSPTTVGPGVWALNVA